MHTMKRKNLDAQMLIRLTVELRNSLEGLAEKDRRTLSDYVRIVLGDHVKRKKK